MLFRLHTLLEMLSCPLNSTVYGKNNTQLFINYRKFAKNVCLIIMIKQKFARSSRTMNSRFKVQFTAFITKCKGTDSQKTVAHTIKGE